MRVHKEEFAISLPIERTQTLLHIHTPKSAGSMLNDILKKNFQESFFRDVPLVSYLKYSQAEMESMLYLYPYICFSSHNYCLKQLPESAGDIMAITFSRDPIQKLISSYFYLRNRKMTAPWHICKGKTLGEMIEWILKEERVHPFWLDTSQVDWIVGEENASLGIIEEAINNEKLLLFATERFDEACVILEKLFPEWLVDCSYNAKANVSTKDYDVSKEEMKMAELLPWIKTDRELHRLASRAMDTLIQKLFDKADFEEKLLQFKSRCSIQPRTTFLQRIKRKVKGFIH